MSVKTGRTEVPSVTQPWMDANFAQINIGRNVGTEPMDSFDWALFQVSVRGIVEILAGSHSQMIEVSGNGGEWLGVPEETHVYMVLNPYVKDQFIVDHVKDCLSALGREFGQDAIAVIFGTSVLV